jgi:hypothetical protein
MLKLQEIDINTEFMVSKMYVEEQENFAICTVFTMYSHNYYHLAWCISYFTKPLLGSFSCAQNHVTCFWPVRASDRE